MTRRGARGIIKLVENISRNGLNLHYIKDLTKKNLPSLTKGLSLNESVISELNHPTFHPKFENYNDQHFLVLRFPEFNKNRTEINTAEVDFVITKKQLIIVQYNKFKTLEGIINSLKKDKRMSQDFFGNSSDSLLFKIISRIFESLFDDLDYMGERVDRTEKKIFSGIEEDLLKRISSLRRDAADFRMNIRPNEDVFKIMKSSHKSFTNNTFLLNNLLATNARLTNLVSGHIETLQILHETNESMLANKINQVMKILTIFAVIVFPLTFISSVWGMNTRLPFQDHPMGFWIVSAIMGISAMVMLLYFKLRKWI